MSKLSGIRSAESNTGSNELSPVQALRIHLPNHGRAARPKVYAQRKPATFYRRSFGSAGRFPNLPAIGFISSDADAALMLPVVVRAAGLEPSWAA